MSEMTAYTWNRLREQIDNCDPIKDVCDEADLVNYIMELRDRLGLSEEQP